eukprot:TRINITY_DN5443_c0_g1_i1.p1 TRINITY_DN5443_c0_g1~~TRINITY_DN5443_c0_g1_i1.p1  ORF type:complete len:1233 (+),score=244.75 TRINITY_DN5443_c0_g1_i1:33-3701(+)
MNMLTKFETKSNRVKGLSFHPTRPWILSSLHSGSIQLWDYRIKTLLDKFDEHDGPVRSLCFHMTQPLFVSGGDDYKIKVWNYKSRRCLFNLVGHLDYIRTVQFHHENPWILSSSDDQTIRVWNWQSRSCISVLTGHNHYVMCASFHPKEDLVVSASLDQTVRVWDISGLRKKNLSPMVVNDESLRLPQNDLFGNTDAVVKFVLEGHDRGVNWAAFNPSLPLIISGADDRQVKLWRMNETKAWEVDTLRGHLNNVSCTIFHPRQEIILSNSEDKTIRVWDMSKRIAIQAFRREHDRFWILAAHPEVNLFAAGHDSGFTVFKLERERPAYVSHNGQILYVKDRYLRSFDTAANRDSSLMLIRRSGTTNPNFRTLSFNPAEKSVLLCSDLESASYEYVPIPSDTRNSENVDFKRGYGVSAVFVARNRFAVLDKTHQIHIKNLKNELLKKLTLDTTADALFPAHTGCVIIRSEDKMILYDLQQHKAIAELATPPIKFAVWSNTGDKESMVALIGKDVIVIANRKLEHQCTIHEAIRIKSGHWDESGVFIYNTLNHLKYCLPNGDNGIIRTLDIPLYIASVKGNKIYCLDRECKIRILAVDTTEYQFKLALFQQKYNLVLKMVRDSNLIGQAIISYLQKKGFPKVALHFVKDSRLRFSLALECGNLEVALECAKEIDKEDCWNRLATEALRQGNHQMVEMSYQRTRNFERLSFLYLITGNTRNLRKMQQIAEKRDDILSRFHNALYTGDVFDRVRILEASGQIPLAYATAVNHGLEEAARDLLPRLKDGSLAESLYKPGSLLFPPIPVLRGKDNWPLLATSKSAFEPAFGLAAELGPKVEDEPLDDSQAGGWSVDNDIAVDEDNELEDRAEHDINADVVDIGEGEEGSGWDDMMLEGLPTTTGPIAGEGYYVPPVPAPSSTIHWLQSKCAADHIAHGSYETAMQLLNQQIGAVNFAPLKPFFLLLQYSSRVLVSGLNGVPPLSYTVQAPNPTEGAKSVAVVPLRLAALIERLNLAYTATTAGKFQEALSHFLYILHAVPFLVVDSRQDVTKVKELIGLCREYTLGLKLELFRKEMSTQKNADPVRLVELACYFTHCKLQPLHLSLSIRSAMNAAFKIRNYLTAAGLARRLLELSPKYDVATQAKKVVKVAETTPEEANKLQYDHRNPFSLCAISYVPIYQGSPSLVCGYCSSTYLPEHRGKTCTVCQVSAIGAASDFSGLVATRSLH